MSIFDKSPQEQVTALYVSYFNRAPDPVGLGYWVGRFNDGFPLSAIADSFSVQPEAVAKYPYLTNPEVASPAAFLNAVYLNLFNRAIDPEGVAYWTAQLASGRAVGDIILDIAGGAQGDDAVIVANKVAVGVDFAQQTADVAGFVYDAEAAAAAVAVLDGVDATDASVTEGKAETAEFVAADAIPGVTFTLTTDVDTFTGTTGNDTFQGLARNLDAFDNINGGTGTDTLNLIGNGSSINAPGATVQDVEIVNLTQNGGAGEFSADIFGNAQQIWQITNSAAITGVNSGTIAGFRNAGVSAVAYDATATEAAIQLDNVANSGNLRISGDDLSTITVAGNIKAGEGVETLTLTLDGAAEPTTLNLAFTADTTIVLGSLGYLGLETVDASASTGGVTSDLAGLGLEDDSLSVTSIIGGSGKDALTVSTADFSAAAVSFNSGAGNDKFTLFANADGNDTAFSITGGAGNDTFTFKQLTNIGNAAEFEDSLITINDFNAAQDVLDISGAVGDRDILINTEVSAISAAATIELALGLAASFTGIGNYSVFNYGNDAYVLNNIGDLAFGTNDGLIKLVGVDAGDLSDSSFVG